jgi:hypothetical protein
MVLNKRILFIVLSVIFVLVIAVVVYFATYNSRLSKNPFRIAFDDALARNDISYCETLDTASGKWSVEHCYINFAEKRGDILICDNVGYSDEYLDKDLCLAKIAITSGDSTVCEKISKASDGIVDMSQSKCYEDYALNTGNTSVCNLLEDVSDITRCKTSAEVYKSLSDE